MTEHDHQVAGGELLVRPLRRGPTGYRHALDFLTTFPHLRPVVVDLLAVTIPRSGRPFSVTHRPEQRAAA